MGEQLGMNHANGAVSVSTKPDGQGNTDLLKEMEDEFTCPICHDYFVLAHLLDCGHSFCYTCIHQWFQLRAKKRRNNHQCPTCRAEVKSEPVKHLALDNIID